MTLSRFSSDTPAQQEWVGTKPELLLKQSQFWTRLQLNDNIATCFLDV